MTFQEVGLWARVERLEQKILETTGVGPGLEKRRLRAFFCLPSWPRLQLPPLDTTPPPGPRTPRPGPGRRDLGAFTAHDTYGFRIWRADASPC